MSGDAVMPLETLMPGLIVRAAARRDLMETFLFLSRNAPDRARRFTDAVETTLRHLIEMPHLGSPRDFADSRFHNLRQWPVPGFKNYLIFYQPFASSNGIEVVRVLHASRDAPLHLSDETTHDES